MHPTENSVSGIEATLSLFVSCGSLRGTVVRRAARIAEGVVVACGN